MDGYSSCLFTLGIAVLVQAYTCVEVHVCIFCYFMLPIMPPPVVLIVAVLFLSEKNSMSVTSEFQHLFPTKISSSLTSWKRSTYEDFVVSIPTDHVQLSQQYCQCTVCSVTTLLFTVALVCLQTCGYTQHVVQAGLLAQADMFFSGVIERGSGMPPLPVPVVSSTAASTCRYCSRDYIILF